MIILPLAFFRPSRLRAERARQRYLTAYGNYQDALRRRDTRAQAQCWSVLRLAVEDMLKARA
jgi:hypothetical protein